MSRHTGKILMLWRHAQAHDDSATGDHGRRLTDRGIADAARSAAAIAAIAKPTQVRYSDAARTRETWEHGRDALGSPAAVPEPTIYMASRQRLIELIESTPDDTDCLMLVGHNPGMSELAGHCLGDWMGMRKADAVILHSAAPDWVTAMHGPWSQLAYIDARALRKAARRN